MSIAILLIFILGINQLCRVSGAPIGQVGNGNDFGVEFGNKIGPQDELVFANVSQLRRLTNLIKSRNTTFSGFKKRLDTNFGIDVVSKISSANASKSHEIGQTSASIGTLNERSRNFTFVMCRDLLDSDEQRVIDFSSAKWNWTNPEDVLIDGLKAKNFTARLNAMVDSSLVQLTIFAILFNQSGEINYAGLKIPVSEGSVKISYLAKNWPFKSVNSSLFYAVTIASSGNGVSSVNSTLNIGNGFFDMPSLAILDGKVKPIKIRYFTDQDSSNGTQVGVIFEIPYFNETLYYDPISSLRSESYAPSSFIPRPDNSANASSLRMLAVLLGILLVNIIHNKY
jgi:hypothetical protein